MSLPTQISPPYSHQSQGTVERFHKTLYGQVRSIRIGLADQLNIDADHLDAWFHAMDHSTCDFSDQSFLSQIRWEDLI